MNCAAARELGINAVRFVSNDQALGEIRVGAGDGCRVTREEAEALCAKYAAEHPDRKVAQWRAQEDQDGEWSVVRIGLPPSSRDDD